MSPHSRAASKDAAEQRDHLAQRARPAVDEDGGREIGAAPSRRRCGPAPLDDVGRDLPEAIRFVPALEQPAERPAERGISVRRDLAVAVAQAQPHDGRAHQVVQPDIDVVGRRHRLREHVDPGLHRRVGHLRQAGDILDRPARPAPARVSSTYCRSSASLGCSVSSTPSHLLQAAIAISTFASRARRRGWPLHHGEVDPERGDLELIDRGARVDAAALR